MLPPRSGGIGREIFSGSQVMSRPSISPDGRRVVFSTGTTDRRFLVVCDLPDCTNVREQPWAINGAAWTPDGRGFAYLNPNDPANIWVQPIEGGAPTPLTHFTDKRLTSFGWSPDGTRLAVSRATVVTNIVMIKGFR